MAWLLIIASFAVIWVASIFKIIFDPRSPSTTEFLGGDVGPKNVMLVIAHPDDESMFFTPTINYLISRGHNLHILCLSNGNADGMGKIRMQELYLASETLKVPSQQVQVLDHPDLQDGFGKVWDTDLLVSIIDQKLHNHAIDLVITFDNYGISGHCNHCDVHKGIRKLLHNYAERRLEAWELVSTNIIRKYIGPLDIWFSVTCQQHHATAEKHYLLNKDPLRSYAAMAQHVSQWVWFRKLFVLFSSYTYINTLKMMTA